MIFFNTIKYLKTTQVIWRIWLKLRRYSRKKNGVKKISFNIPNLSLPPTSISSEMTKIFNQEITFNSINWLNAKKNKLWYYHLHYFDYLEQCSNERGLNLIDGWIDSNSSSSDYAWDPYPTSLRTVNWIKFIQSRQISPSEKIINSLKDQMDHLFRFRELHLLANHYFKNLVALLFLSYLLNDEKRLRWVLKEIQQQINEQSDDGLHYEYSPTYHALFTKDLIDIYNLLFLNNLGPEIQKELSVLIPKSLQWAKHLSFNNRYFSIGDVNYEGCPSISTLKKYYTKVFGSIEIPTFSCVKHFPVIYNNSLKLMLLNTPFNPPYNPAHSHCDKLSILIWNNDIPILVDTGNYIYEKTSERTFSRSVSAHNTIQIDNREQAEIWDVFRIGARGKIKTHHIWKNEISAIYHYKNASHHRVVRTYKSGFMIIDKLNYPGRHNYKFYLHINPGLKYELRDNILIFYESNLHIILPENEIEIDKTDYYPSMFVKQQKTTVIVKGIFNEQLTINTEILL